MTSYSLSDAIKKSVKNSVSPIIILLYPTEAFVEEKFIL